MKRLSASLGLGLVITLFTGAAYGDDKTDELYLLPSFYSQEACAEAMIVKPFTMLDLIKEFITFDNYLMLNLVETNCLQGLVAVYTGLTIPPKPKDVECQLKVWQMGSRVEGYINWSFANIDTVLRNEIANNYLELNGIHSGVVINIDGKEIFTSKEYYYRDINTRTARIRAINKQLIGLGADQLSRRFEEGMYFGRQMLAEYNVNNIVAIEKLVQLKLHMVSARYFQETTGSLGSRCFFDMKLVAQRLGWGIDSEKGISLAMKLRGFENTNLFLRSNGMMPTEDGKDGPFDLSGKSLLLSIMLSILIISITIAGVILTVRKRRNGRGYSSHR